MVGTVVDTIQGRAVLGQQLLEAGMGGVDEVLGEVAPGHAGLVGHQHTQIPGVSRPADGFSGAREECQAAGMVHVPHLLADGAVPVQKECPPFHALSSPGGRERHRLCIQSH